MKSIGAELQDYIAAQTGRPCGLMEVPEGATMPFYNIHPSAGPTDESSMGSPNTIGFQVFTVDTVGSSPTQIDEAEHRMKESLKVLHKNISSVYGPPTVRHNGSAREDNRTYRAMLVVTVPVTE